MLHSHIKYMSRKEQVLNSLKALSSVISGVRLQNSVKASYEKFGLSKATWMALQHLPAAKAVFGEEPSLENLSAIGSSDIKLRESKHTTSSVVADWLDNTADGATNFVETAKYHLDGLFKEISDLAEEVDNADDLDDTAEVYDLPCDERYRQVSNLRAAYRGLESITDDDTTASKLEVVEGYLAHVSNMIPTADGNQIPSSPAGIGCVENLEEESIGSLGYTLDSTVALADDILDLIEDSINFVDAKGSLIAREMSLQADKLREAPNTPEEATQPLEEAQVSQEDILEDSVLSTKYVSAMITFLDCTGHVALKFLDTITVIEKATESE